MEVEKRDTHSRRKTIWDDQKELPEPRRFIRDTIHDLYNQKHQSLLSTDEDVIINFYEPKECPFCGSTSFIKFGKTANGINRFRCRVCSKTFTPTTGTIFDNHKISLKDWLEFCFNIFRHVSITADSWNNRNAFMTSRYWLEKLFIITDGIQDDIVLSGTIWLDETYISERKGDIKLKSDGQKYRGHSMNQYCIGVATDGKTSIAFFEGMGHPSSQRTFDTFAKHIAPGSMLIHDREKSHSILVKKLSLSEQVYSASELKKMPQQKNPLQPINHVHAILKDFLRSHSGFMRTSLQGYLNIFILKENPPIEFEEKMEIVLDLAFTKRKQLRYRDFYKATPTDDE